MLYICFFFFYLFIPLWTSTKVAGIFIRNKNSTVINRKSLVLRFRISTERIRSADVGELPPAMRSSARYAEGEGERRDFF